MKKVILFALHAMILSCLAGCKKDSGDETPKKAMVTTIAGIGDAGYVDATAAFAKFSRPTGVAVHSDGTLYVTDANNRRIRKITKEGLVFTLAGNGNVGLVNGSATMASFMDPRLVETDAQGNLYILDASTPQVRKVTPGGDVSGFAGNATQGFADGAVANAKFMQNWGIAFDDKGAMYISDTYNYRVRKIANGQVTTFAGTGTPGFLDGDALQARFGKPRGIAIDKQGNLYVCDEDNFRIRKITPAGIVSTYAGNGNQAFTDGQPGTGALYLPNGIVIDSQGNLYVSDVHRIRKISTDGSISTIAGGTPGFSDGEGSQAQFSYASGMDIDAAGNIYIADEGNHRIRKISFK